MIIANKFEPLDEEGALSGEDVVFSRQRQDCLYKRLVIRGITSMNDNIKIGTTDRDIIISKEENEEVPLQVSWVGERFGLVKETKVRLQIIFLDSEIFLNIITGFINIGTRGNDFFYESTISNHDEELLDSDKELVTKWIDRKDLISVLGATLDCKDSEKEYRVMETMYEVELRYGSNEVVSYKIIKTYDLSNGKLDELDRKKAMDKALKEKEKRKRIEDNKKRVSHAKGKEIQKMFDKLLNR